MNRRIDSDEEEDEEEEEVSRDDDEDDTNNEGIEAEQPAAKKQRLDKGEHRLGSIVRIKLKNFVTYDQVEYFPGANLNMIIGPNGTGKSTLVCAIALGLNGKPDLLGRQKELKDFVKRGAEKAYVEIELKGKDGNYVIRRTFTASAKGSKWKLNGEHVKETRIKEVTKKLNVQVDNLCQFLPQDKVSEFAKMNSQALLKETERAAGGSGMIDSHMKLIGLRNEQKNQGSTVEGEEKNIENLEKKNTDLEKEVERYKQRETMLEKITLLDMAVSSKKFEQGKSRYSAFKATCKSENEKVKKIESELSPLENLKKSLNDEIKVAELSARDYKADVKSLINNDYAHSMENFENLENAVTGSQKKIDQLKRKEKERQLNILKLTRELDSRKENSKTFLDQLVEFGTFNEDGEQIKDPTVGRYADINREEQEIRNKMNEVMKDVEELKDERREFEKRSEDIRKERHRKERELDGLDQFENIQLELLKKIDNDAYRAYQWLKNNEDKFDLPVLGPLCLLVKPKDPSMAQMLESRIGGSLKTFVCQTRKDFQVFSRAMENEVRARTSNTCFEGVRMPSQNITESEIRKMGFDGFLTDFLDPSIHPCVLQTLCMKNQINNIPYSRRELDANQRTQIERNQGISSYIVMDNTYVISRAYKDSVVKVSKIGRPNFLANTVDVERQEELRREIHDVNNRLNAEVENAKVLQKKEDVLQKRHRALSEEKKALKEQRVEFSTVKKTYYSLEEKIKTIENKIENEKDVEPIDVAEAALRKVIDKTNRKRINVSSEVCTTFEKMLVVLKGRSTNVLHSIELQSKMAELTTRGKLQTDELAYAKAALQDAVERMVVEKANVVVLQKRALNIWNNATEEQKTKAQTDFVDNDIEEMEDQIVQQRTLSELAGRTDRAVVEDYERRKLEIVKLRKDLDKKKARFEKISSEIETIKTAWMGGLTSLVEKVRENFSSAFDKIGCVGDIVLRSEDEDYDKWALDIMVKFRDEEKIQVLSGSRQSGGERSVSTILYLMALQELSKAPFRVVDEINQGMDPRNERLVHGQMVDCACETGDSQYFLITPKLLPGLKYHESMHVSCIFNGRYEPYNLNLRNQFDLHRQHLQEIKA